MHRMIGVYAGIPVPEEFFESQKIDHLGVTDHDGVWSQRYYSYGKHFDGPGHPIFLILGGEGGISPDAGIVYPFVGDHLAKTFGAYVLQPEHRFYGKSRPIPGPTVHLRSTKHSNHYIDEEKEDPRVKLFTSEQALHDAMTLLEHVRNDLGCSPSKDDPSLYCPVITVGGSYPGFLSAFARILFPEVVDMAYAASAPMKFYAQETSVHAYYDHITDVAEDTLSGCAAGVKLSLLEIERMIQNTKSRSEMESLALEVGICEGSIPEYIFSSGDDGSSFRTKMVHELMMVVGYTFANDNMANYPPGKDTRLYKACEIFTYKDLSPTKKVETLLTERLNLGSRTQRYPRLTYNNHDAPGSSPSPPPTCWSMNRQLPSGPNATITGGDWSGDGTGPDGESWDFQTCTLLVEAIGFSEESMFPARNWTMEWLEDHCMSRFGVNPRPKELVERFGFNDLISNNVTKILFTNGLKDGWSVSGIQTNLSESLIALNFENGAHHSDLNHVGPSPRDSDDIQEGYRFVARLLGDWLGELRNDFGGPSTIGNIQ
ncbi:unnamed protein product [Pseudo-nitzschia multistriata]|uniref:Uncharacterized protein n=1 Tax=Pseudo-nitzschia multistriata TaxID=183589 RepID=A0A448Z3L8_9STRA|nr:unnamed protein product [Pseudo-nitzschia multistriata]